MVTQIYKIDLVPGSTITKIHVNQNDSISRQIIFKLFVNGTEFIIPDTAYIMCQGTKANGRGFSVTCTPVIGTNEVQWNIHSYATDVAGAAECQLIIWRLIGDTVAETLGTAKFILQVQKAALADSTDMGVEGPVVSLPALSIGTVRTLQPGSAATAELVGDARSVKLNLGIPRGDGWSSASKTALIRILEKIVYTDPEARIDILDLETALNGGEVKTRYSITNQFRHAQTSNPATFAYEGNSYLADITTEEGYRMESLTVTMGGVDITASAYINGQVNIPAVTGNIVITAVASNTVVLTGSRFTYGVSNGGVAPDYYRANQARASYTNFDIPLKVGHTYKFTFVSTAGNGYFAMQAYTQNALDQVKAGKDFTDNDVADSGWISEGTQYVYKVGQRSGSDVVGVRFAVKNNSDTNITVTPNYIVSLTIEEVEG